MIDGCRVMFMLRQSWKTAEGRQALKTVLVIDFSDQETAIFVRDKPAPKALGGKTTATL